MTPRFAIFGVLVVLSGCCLGTDISSGTGETTESTSTGGLGTIGGTTTGSGTGITGTGGSTGTGTVGATGTGGAGTVTVSPNPIAFGYVPLLSTSIGCTTVSNDSNASITITGVGSFETEGGSFAVATTDDAHPPNPFSFPITITARGNAQVCFTFDCPVTQNYLGQATLLTDDPNVNLVVQLTGWCGGPQIFCSPLTLAFGRITGQTATLPVSCLNSGTSLPGLNLTIGPLNVQGAAFSAAFDTTTNPYPEGGLEPGQSVQIDVTYAPNDEMNDYGVLVIPNNGGQGETPYVSLSGQN